MIEQFLNHIERHQLCKTTDNILLGVSGGVDSMVMLDLFRRSGFRIAVAHCNFQLRGENSTADENLVRLQCERFGIPFFGKRFETKKEASAKGESIQVTARNLRYAFFSEIVSGHRFDYVATAHHVNDNIETIILNLTRGTGIDGLIGIPVRTGNVIRPLLFAPRQMISDHANASALQWREDESNDSDDYSRNYIRHHIVPHLKQINPNLEQTFLSSLTRISGGVHIARRAINEIFSGTIRKEGDRFTIDKKLLNMPDAAVLLWEFLKPSGFTFAACEEITKDHQSGRRFYGKDQILTIDRSTLILEPADGSVHPDISIERSDARVFFGNEVLRFERMEKEKFVLQLRTDVAQLDAGLVRFPLTWRRWRSGDTIIPFGMKSPKKISDLLIDARVPLPDKEKMTVLQSGNDIIWVVGQRIHDSYKVSKLTTDVLIVSRITS